MIGIAKDRSLMFRKAKWVKGIADEQGLKQYNNDEYKVIRFKEVSEEVKSYFQPIANKLSSKRTWVIETNYVNQYEIGDRLIIPSYTSDRVNKDKWIISNVITYQRKSEQLSLTYMKNNPNISYVLELE
jgi:hypothetical protein